MRKIEEVVADNINKLLKEKNINKNDLAKIAGVSESTVGKWTLEKATPRMGAVQKISDYFDLPKSYILEEEATYKINTSQYNYYPTAISAGLPIKVDGMCESEKISLPDNMMGKWAGNKDIFITRIFGDSMNKTMPDGSLIAVKPVSSIESLKNGDIVVFSDNYDYSVKKLIKLPDEIIFRPHSTDIRYTDYKSSYDNKDLKIHGKVILYIVEMD